MDYVFNYAFKFHINNNYVNMDWRQRGMELPSIRLKALAKTFSHQLWPLLAVLARAIIEASGLCSGFKSDVRQFNSPVEPVHIDIIALVE